MSIYIPRCLRSGIFCMAAVLLLLLPFSTVAQSISGFACVAPGGYYGPYTINGVSWNSSDKWCVTNGTINSTGSSCSLNGGAPSIGIQWNPFATSGTVSYYHPGTATTPIATLTVTFHNPGSISPGNPFVPANTPINVTISNSASATTCNGSSVNYIWESQTGGGSYSLISGANSASLSLTNVTFTQYTNFRRGAISQTDPSHVFYTGPVPIIVAQPATVSPASQTINAGATPTQLAANGASGCNGSFNYLWWWSPDGVSGWQSTGVTQQNYTPPSPTVPSIYYRVGCTCTGTGSTVNSNVAVINVLLPVVSGTITPATQLINVNTVAATLNATLPTGGNNVYTYQWQSSPNGSSGWQNVTGGTGANTLSYSPGVLAATTFFRLVNTSNGANANSSAVVVNISPTTLLGVAAPNNSVGNADNGINWVAIKGFDDQGNTITETKQFYDNTGQLVQGQDKLKYRKDANTVYTHVFARQPMNDVYGRPAASSLSAPIDNSEFAYKADFIKAADGSNYTYKNFDKFNPSGSESNLINSPDPVGGQATRGSLAWYYGVNNIWEPYAPTSNYPYTRQTFYGDGSGNVKASAGAGEIFKMGMGRETGEFVYPVLGEFVNYRQARAKYFTIAEMGELGGVVQSSYNKVARDANGREVFTLTDVEGHVLMSARPGSDLPLPCGGTISTDLRYKAFINSTSTLDINPLAAIEVYTGSTLFYQGLANNFAPSSLGVQNGQVKCTEPFSFKTCPATGCTGFIRATPRSQIHYFKILADNTPVSVSGGSWVLYNMSTETAMSFGGSGNLNKGYYKLVATNGDVNVQYTNSYSDVSYYFYNQLGQLVASVAPEGVKKLAANMSAYPLKTDIPFITLYEYNAGGKMIKSTTPDGGVTEFVYRKDGKARFSQNAEQLARVVPPGYGKPFSYTNYDQYGRIIETGEYQPDASGLFFNADLGAGVNPMRDVLEYVSPANPNGGLGSGTKKDAVVMLYDEADNTHGLSAYTQDPSYLAGAVSKVVKYSSIVNNAPVAGNIVSAVWHSYDEDGKMIWQIQMIPNMNGTGAVYKTTDYTYDNMGRMIKKVFQKNSGAETFVHYFEYDPATKKLWKVYTNTADVSATKTLRATYIYYLHGLLKRVEIAGTLQGIDYTYNLQGALKAINNSDKNKDPGGDGIVNSNSTDAYGMILDYYAGDYKNDRTSGIQPLNGVNTAAIVPADSYAGDIKAMTWFSKKPASVITPTDAATTYVYNYDSKYQFVSGTWGTGINFVNTPASFVQTNFFKETALDPVSGASAYDANGNIKFLQRSNAAGTFAEQYTYKYLNTLTGQGSATNYNTNKLQSVENTAGGSPVTYADYTYNEKGQLIFENNATPALRKYIRYDAGGKVTAVARDAGFTLPVVEYIYNETGQRIVTKSYNSFNQLMQVTYYFGDVIYTQPVNSGVYGSLGAKEYEMDGGMNGRLGIYYPVSGGVYAYELTDHLGNVRAVIAQNGVSYEVKMYSDYYPYGLVLQQTQSPEGYRYQYQGKYAEKDGETDWNAFELRMYDSRIARWLQYDPKGEFFSPYLAMGNNPVSNTDPDGGRTSSPIFDKETGKFLGVDSKGFAGDILFMSKADYNRMSNNGKKVIDHSLLQIGSSPDYRPFVTTVRDMQFGKKYRALLTAFDYTVKNGFDEMISKYKFMLPSGVVLRLYNNKLSGAYIDEADGFKYKYLDNDVNDVIDPDRTIAQHFTHNGLGPVYPQHNVMYNLSYSFVYMTTVEDVQGLFWHEYVGHGLAGWDGSYFQHMGAYWWAEMYPKFSQTTQKYRDNHNENKARLWPFPFK